MTGITRIAGLALLVAGLATGSPGYAAQHAVPSGSQDAPAMMQEGDMGTGMDAGTGMGMGSGMDGMNGMMGQMSEMMALCTKMMEAMTAEMDQKGDPAKTS